jgi:isoleucyl-tRNA synthetase
MISLWQVNKGGTASLTSPLTGGGVFCLFYDKCRKGMPSMSEPMDYKATLNMPKTDFPMRANLPQREPEILARWEELDLYNLVQETRKDHPTFILHDGPPYANGDIHLGHALNKILKDLVVKYATMAGYNSPYVPGWDTHGLPIELKALKDGKLDRHKIDPVALRQTCAQTAKHWASVQSDQFQRLGVRGDWENPYLTLQPEFEAREVEIFGKMASQGHIYRGLKPVYWCAVDETALAEAEIEYHDKTSFSIYVQFPVVDGKGKLPDSAHVVIWTTTPWTIPANLAVALHPTVEYGLYATEKGDLLLAKELANKVFEAIGLSGGALKGSFTGAELEGVTYRHLLFDRISPVVLSDHVTTEDGTGLVHTAPGHGHEDFVVGQQYGLAVLNPLNDKGVFTAEGGQFAGLFYEKANPVIIEAMDEAGMLLAQGKIRHSYAHCWRCQNPVIYRATVQWFAKVEGFMDDAMKAVRDVRWIPEWGQSRITNMIEGLSDWCISRQRAWGMPIPILTCEQCNEPSFDERVFGKVASVFEKEGGDAWWIRPAVDFYPEGGLTCKHCGSTHFRKEKDILDVWFDSGSSYAGVLERRPNLSWPADLYLEGSDQHRGWFKSSLLTSVVAREGRPPYRAVLTHGFTVDEQGRKMSKSLGNGVDPHEVIKQYGADILRLWVASTDYRGDMAVSQNILKQVAESYRKMRNTLRYLLGNIADFNPAIASVERSELEEIDRWAMHRLQEVVGRVGVAYKNYDFHMVYHALNNYCAVDLSAVYLDILKDRLYTSRPDSAERRSAQTVLYYVADALIRMVTPILSFTAEEAYGHLTKEVDAPPTPQVLTIPHVDLAYRDEALAEKWEKLLEIRESVQAVLERARADKHLGSSQEAAVHLFVTGSGEGGLADLLRGHLNDLPSLFIVSDVKLFVGAQSAPSGTYFGKGPGDVSIEVLRAEGEKCQRCWNRRELGIIPQHPTLCERCASVVISLQVAE